MNNPPHMNEDQYNELLMSIRGPSEEWGEEDLKYKNDPTLEAPRVSMCQREKFDTIYRHYNDINKLDGDIVECGIWQGGMSIFLAKLFQEKHIWMCDSFAGFQPLDIATFNKPGDPEYHTEYYQQEHLDRHNIPYNIAAPYDSVVRNLARFGLQPDNRIKLLKGWVKDTLHPDNCPIKKISLLRIDVDSYSATREVLEHLFDKVVDGGFIIFDDCCLTEANIAMCEFMDQRGIRFYLRHRDTDQFVSSPRSLKTTTNPCGCYMVKGEYTGKIHYDFSSSASSSPSGSIKSIFGVARIWQT
tara:strand:+ start:5984 stop:6883 length:900 start_codon:yes stop_codon:yes gene_type:complete